MLIFKLYYKDELVARTTENGTLAKLSDNAPIILFHYHDVAEIPYKDFYEWMERTRVFSRHRLDISSLLKRYGLKKYSVFEIIKATKGRKVQDDYWIEMLEE